MPQTLKDRLIAMIRNSGPISVATYMDLCLHDRRDGYYATRPGLGEDFTTAPEISQIFGELVGLWAAHEWQQMGAPKQVSLVEIGPGRGTLMDDALRATHRLDSFHAAADIFFIEPSPILQANLRERFKLFDPGILPSLDAIPADRPFLLIANEWLDCLPVQQFVRVGDAWHERVIGLNEHDALQFGLSASALPAELEAPATQQSLEIQTGLRTLAETFDHLCGSTVGRGLFIDYGTTQIAPEDSLRSYQKGRQIDPLIAPGLSDLTCDVDFMRLARLARAKGLQVDGPISQSQFLLSLGAEARLNQLARQHPDRGETLYTSVKKLVDPAEMGTRFQAISIGHPDLPPATSFPRS